MHETLCRPSADIYKEDTKRSEKVNGKVMHRILTQIFFGARCQKAGYS